MAALAPVIVAILPGRRVPQVIIFIGQDPLRLLVIFVLLLVYPVIAVLLHRSAPITPADVGITATEPVIGTSPPPEVPG